MSFILGIGELLLGTLDFCATVQFNYNFTHARDSTRGITRVFACEMQIFAV